MRPTYAFDNTVGFSINSPLPLIPGLTIHHAVFSTFGDVAQYC